MGVLFFLACTKSVPVPQDLSCPRVRGLPTMREAQLSYVTKVADGDTFTACLLPGMDGSVRVRVLGIDCPEAHENAKCKREGERGGKGCAEQIPLGKKASAYAHRLLLKKKVFLESPRGDGRFELDMYGRVLAYVRTERGEDFGKRMIKDAGCENYQWKYPHPRGVDYGQ
jgi:endonuclease YncB( thermonuclease family)